MTRDERIEAAAIGWKAQLDQPTTFRDSLTSALDAALADLGGLDGLADMVGSRLPLAAERVALRADRDRLREALREIAELPVDGSLVRFQAAVERACRVALRVSEAGT